MANDFKNVSVIKLSPYSPELNPIEQVWRWLRQRDLSNQSFMDYDDIISKSAMHGIGFRLLPKSHQNVLEKMDRPDQLVFQIGINGEVVELQIIENGLSWKGKDSP
ncbi:transposase [Vibrio parahaemolyticus]